jgi:hypothetical protein
VTEPRDLVSDEEAQRIISAVERHQEVVRNDNTHRILCDAHPCDLANMLAIVSKQLKLLAGYSKLHYNVATVAAAIIDIEKCIPSKATYSAKETEKSLSTIRELLVDALDGKDIV